MHGVFIISEQTLHHSEWQQWFQHTGHQILLLFLILRLFLWNTEYFYLYKTLQNPFNEKIGEGNYSFVEMLSPDVLVIKYHKYTHYFKWSGSLSQKDCD